MSVQRIVGLLGWVCAAGAAPVAARAQIWLPAACDIKPGHQLVNSGMQSLRSAFTTKFADQKAKDLKDAERVLTQAVTTGKQEKNPAAWYYLGRYYLMADDLAAADSALSKALTLGPACKEDIGLYRRQAWVPVFNAGVQAWQGGQTDSAIASFRRANQIYKAEPMGFVYIANLFVGREEPDSAGKKTDVVKYHTDSLVYATRMDSAAKYFRLAAAAASDAKYARERRDALFNVARVYHSAKPYTEAIPAHRQSHTRADPQYRQVAKAYEAGLAKNPYSRDALYNLAGVSYLIGDSASVLPLAQRLYAVDPLNRSTLAKVAGGWQLKGKKDSVLYYLQVADSLPVEITVSSFSVTEKGVSLDGQMTNFRPKASAPLKITFDFLDAKGNVVATQSQDVPTLDPNASQEFKLKVELKVEQPSVVAWRYKRG